MKRKLGDKKTEKSVEKTALDSWLIREKGEMSKIVPNVLHNNSKRGVKRKQGS